MITLAEFEDAVRSHVDMSEHEAEKIFGEISSSSSAVGGFNIREFHRFYAGWYNSFCEKGDDMK